MIAMGGRDNFSLRRLVVVLCCVLPAACFWLCIKGTDCGVQTIFVVLVAQHTSCLSPVTRVRPPRSPGPHSLCHRHALLQIISKENCMGFIRTQTYLCQPLRDPHTQHLSLQHHWRLQSQRNSMHWGLAAASLADTHCVTRTGCGFVTSNTDVTGRKSHHQGLCAATPPT